MENQTSDLLRAQRHVLELMARNMPIEEILREIVRLIETFASGCLSTVYFVEDGKLQLGAAPSWPESFVRAVEGCPIGMNHGTCGTAAHLGQRIVSTNVREDECWGPYRDWILSYGIQAAWSTPVLSRTGEVMATVSMCWKEPRVPTDRDFEIVDVATRLMSIAVERKQHEELIAEQGMKLAASSKLAALGEMSAGLAHEINNPLAILHVHANQLQLLCARGLLSPEGVRVAADDIERTVARISRIIQGLKAISRDGEQDPARRVRVAEVIEDTLSFCRERFLKNGIRLELDDAGEDLVLECRPVQLSQVLLNLLNNAFDAVLPLAEKWVRIEVRREDDSCRISVVDSGDGIPETLRRKLMTPFFTTKGRSSGTGLGLSISRRIVESHRGRLELAEASPNTRFDVRLPMSEARP